MPSIVEFLVKVKDLASAPLVKLASTGSKSFTQLGNNVNSFAAKFNRLGMSISDIDKKLDSLRKSREISLDSRQVRRVNQEITELERRKARLEGGGSTGGGFGRLIGTSLAMAGIAGGIGGIGAVAGAGMDREATKMRFEVMGGEKPGAQLAANLTHFADKSIYGKEVFQGAQTMMAFDVATKKVMPNIKMLGDVAMGNVNRFNLLTLAFSQTNAAGKLMGNDLLQYINAGFNPLQEISKQTGKNMATLRKEMEDGKISFKMVEGAFIRATSAGGRFHNMTAKLGKTGFGQWQALKGSVEGLAASMGLRLMPVIKEVIGLTQFFVDNTHWIFGMAAAWGAYTVAVQIASFATKGLTVWQALSNTLALINPWGALIAGLILLATWIHHVVQKYGGWMIVLEAAGQTATTIGTKIGLAFKDAFQTVSYWTDMGMLRVKQFWEFIKGGPKTASVQIKALQANRENQRKKNLTEIAASTEKSSSAWQKVLNNKGKKGKGADEIAGVPGGGGGLTMPSTVEDTNKGITGGGVKNVTINLGKFFDDLHFHSSSTGEGIKDIEEKMLEMFLRVTNSGNAIAGQS